MLPETYVTETHCHETTNRILDNQRETDSKLDMLGLLQKQSTEEMVKLRKVIRGNGHIKGSMLDTMRITQDKLNEHIAEEKRAKEQTIEVTENKKDRNLTMKVLMVSSITSVVLGILNIIFGQ